MSAGAKYGLFLGLLFGLSDRVPGLAILLWTVLSIQAAVGLWIIWRRLQLPWFLVGSIASLAVSLRLSPSPFVEVGAHAEIARIIDAGSTDRVALERDDDDGLGALRDHRSVRRYGDGRAAQRDTRLR